MVEARGAWGTGTSKSCVIEREGHGMIKAEEGEGPVSAGMVWGKHDLAKTGCLP